MNATTAVHSQALFHRHNVTQPKQPVKADDGNPLTNPAGSARLALIDRPDMPSKPFGSLVSLFARGLPMPPFENADTVAPLVEQDNTGIPSDATTP